MVTNKIGKRYNGFVVIERMPDVSGKVYWKCRCDCGVEFTVSNRKIAQKKSCGCLIKNSRNNPNGDFSFFVKSGMLSKDTYNRLKQEWRSMHNRCREKYHDSKIYYQRGIKVCEEWHDFRVFALWAIKSGYKNDLTLDRINNDRGYSPDNCRWATWKTQQNNKRNNAWVTYQGKTQTLKQWSEELGMDYGLLKCRWSRGWTVPMLFTEKRKNQYA